MTSKYAWPRLTASRSSPRAGEDRGAAAAIPLRKRGPVGQAALSDRTEPEADAFRSGRRRPILRPDKPRSALVFGRRKLKIYPGAKLRVCLVQLLAPIQNSKVRLFHRSCQTVICELTAATSQKALESTQMGEAQPKQGSCDKLRACSGNKISNIAGRPPALDGPASSSSGCGAGASRSAPTARRIR